jgi:hypothetical protein
MIKFRSHEETMNRSNWIFTFEKYDVKLINKKSHL